MACNVTNDRLMGADIGVCIALARRYLVGFVGVAAVNGPGDGRGVRGGSSIRNPPRCTPCKGMCARDPSRDFSIM